MWSCLGGREAVTRSWRKKQFLTVCRAIRKDFLGAEPFSEKTRGAILRKDPRSHFEGKKFFWGEEKGKGRDRKVKPYPISDSPIVVLLVDAPLFYTYEFAG